MNFFIKLNIIFVTFILFFYPLITEIQNFQNIKKLFYGVKPNNEFYDLINQIIFYSLPQNNILFIFFIVSALYYLFLNYSLRKIDQK